MKHILKKVTSVALSFALLGTGTVIASNTTTPQSTTTLVAEASSLYTYGYCPVLTQTMKKYESQVYAVYAEYYRGTYTGYVKVDTYSWGSYWVQCDKKYCR